MPSARISTDVWSASARFSRVKWKTARRSCAGQTDRTTDQNVSSGCLGAAYRNTSRLHTGGPVEVSEFNFVFSFET